MTSIDINKAITELKELEVMAAEVAAEIDSIKGTLKAELTRSKTDELSVGIFKIRYKTVKGRRFDTKAFKAANSKLYDSFRKEVISKRFSVQ